MIEKIGHYAMESSPTIYDEEALTALELAGRTAAKTNECVEVVNEAVSSIPGKVAQAFRDNLEDGTFDRQIAEYTEEVTAQVKDTQETVTKEVNDAITQMTHEINGTEASIGERLDNLLGSYTAGTTTMDAEIYDARVGADGKTYDNLGQAIRYQIGDLSPVVLTFSQIFNVDTENGVITVNTNASGRILYKIVTRADASGIGSFVPTATEWSYDPASTGTFHFVMNVANTENVTLRIVNNGVYYPSAGDIILFSIFVKNVFPVALAPNNISVNGYNLFPMPDGLKKNTRQLIPLKASILVDLIGMKVTFKEGTYALPYYARGAYVLADDITINFPYDGYLKYFVFNQTDKTLTMKDRYYWAKDDEYIIGAVVGLTFVPIDVPSTCISYVGEDVEEPDNTVYDMLGAIHGLYNATPENPFNIVLAGDSITFGAGATGSGTSDELIVTHGGADFYRQKDSTPCWAKYMRDFLESNFNATVTNNGASGTNVRWWHGTMATTIPAGTDLCILTIGTNDRYIRTDTGETSKADRLAAFYTDLVAIVTYCKTNGIRIVLTTPIPASKADEDTKQAMNPDNIAIHIYDIAGVIKRVCSEYGVPCCDLYNEIFFYALDNNLDYDTMLPDGLHPGNELHKIMFYRYLKLLQINPDYNII